MCDWKQALRLAKYELKASKWSFFVLFLFLIMLDVKSSAC